MIYSSNVNNKEVFQFWQYKATFTDNGEPREMLCNAKDEIEQMIQRFPRMSGLQFHEVIPTEVQKERLEIVNAVDSPNKSQWITEVELFVKTGAIPSNTNSQFLIAMATTFTKETSEHLTQRKEMVWEKIKNERDRRKYLGVKVGQHWFHSDDASRIQQVSLFIMGAAVPPIPWKTLTLSPPPVFVNMSQELAAGIFQGTAASDTAIFTAAEAHRIAMEMSADPEMYDFITGWPVSIEDEVI